MELTQDMKTVLTLCREPRGVLEMMQALNWKSRTSFRVKILVPLLNEGLVSMTIPEKPNSHKQRYKTAGITSA